MHVLVITTDPGFDRRVRRAAELVGEWHVTTVHDGRPSTVEDCVAHHGPGVLVIGPDLPRGRSLRIAARVRDEHAQVAIVLAQATTKKLLDRALRAGIDDVVTPDASRRKWARALSRVTTRERPPVAWSSSCHRGKRGTTAGTASALRASGAVARAPSADDPGEGPRPAGGAPIT